MFIPDPIDEKRLKREGSPKDIDLTTREYFKTRGWWSQIREKIIDERQNNFNGEVLVRFDLIPEESGEKITGYLCGELFELNHTKDILIKKIVFLTCNESTEFVYNDFLKYNPVT